MNNIAKNSILKNSIIKNNITRNNIIKNNTKPKFSIKLILLSIACLILLCCIIYIIICVVNFNKKTCYKKKDLFEYMFDFSSNSACLIEKEPVLIKPVEPEIKPVMDILPTFEKKEKKEVYHISNQDYTYEQSKCKCESYGGKLATKAQLIDAYNKGANWCSYGWSEKQSAYYPVQKCEYDKIVLENERLPKHKRRYCGFPGLNGGYFPNAQLRFGANCFGVKPDGELNKMKKPYCPAVSFCKMESNYQSAHKLDTDDIVSFNNDQWNMNV